MTTAYERVMGTPRSDNEYLPERAPRGSRSLYQRGLSTFKLTIPANSTSWGALTQAGNSDYHRMKRIQTKMVIGSTSTPLKGWFGLVRMPEGMSLDASDLPTWGDPVLLRPSLYMSNKDHATYWDAYLPAIDLAQNGSLHVLASNLSGSSVDLDFVVRWVFERSTA